jgi:hypothetical protein
MASGGRIILTATLHADTLALRMENDIAANRGQAKGVAGVGLANTRERLNQIYTGGSSFVAQEEDQTFVLDLRIPTASPEVEGVQQ